MGMAEVCVPQEEVKCGHFRNIPSESFTEEWDWDRFMCGMLNKKLKKPGRGKYWEQRRVAQTTARDLGEEGESVPQGTTGKILDIIWTEMRWGM